MNKLEIDLKFCELSAQMQEKKHIIAKKREEENAAFSAKMQQLREEHFTRIAELDKMLHDIKAKYISDKIELNKMLQQAEAERVYNDDISAL